MKKILAILLCALMLFALAACKTDDGYKDDDKDPSGNKGSKVSFFVNVDNVKVELGASADAVIEALGTPKSSSPVGSCGGQGTLTKYVYASLEVHVLATDKTSTIDKIVLLDDTVSTPEGIRMGSTESDVKSKLGTPTSKAASSYTYVSGNKNLIVTFRDGAVVGIDYMVKTAG
ncbi:MAG: hypothetical protein J6S10_04675 [Clostridia bacterium]|nr:hypothetical protein [Clostridia bacterium]